LARDGAGAPVKRTQYIDRWDGEGEDPIVQTEETIITYSLQSSVLKMVIDELDPNGAKTKGHIYAGGRKIAEQDVTSSTNAVRFKLTNPVTGTCLETNESGDSLSVNEYDPVGATVPTWDPYNELSGPPLYPDIVQSHEQLYVNGGDPFNYSGGYTLDGLPVSEAQLAHMMDTGAGVAGLFFHGKMIGFWDFTGHGHVGTSGGNFWLPQTERVWVDGGPPNFYHDEEGLDTVKFYLDEPNGHWEVRVTGYLSFGGGFWGGLAQNQRPQNTVSSPLTADEVGVLYSDLKNLLTNPDCAGFIEAVLQQLITDTGRTNYDTTDILTLFDKVKTGRGFDWQPGLNAQARAGGGYDHNGKNIASMSIKPTQGFANLSNRSSSVSRGRIVSHELFHVAGYDHRAMAMAAYAVGGRFDQSWRAWRGDFPDPQNDRFFSGPNRNELIDGAYSGFFKNVLDQYCK
jgi:hypothetical protein